MGCAVPLLFPFALSPFRAFVRKERRAFKEAPKLPITVCPYDPARLQPAHNGTILAHGGLSLPGTPLGSAFGVIRAGMAQEPARDPRVSKIYVPLSGEATLVTDEERVPLRPGSVY